MKHKENLSKIFNTDIVETKNSELVLNSNEEASEQEDDYQLARRTMRNIINKGESALEDVLELARSNEHPRTYEVAGQIIKAMSEISKDLLELHKQKRDLSGKDEAPKTNIENMNNVFVGTTNDLIKMLNKKDVQNDQA